MAEAISLGASVITFITVIKAVAPIYASIKDGPDDIIRLQSRLQSLHMLLANIESISSTYPDCAEDPGIKKYWNDKSTTLRSDFTAFENFTQGLNSRGKIRWLLTDRSRANKILDRLSEDIMMLNFLIQITMDSYIARHQTTQFQRILHAQTPVLMHVIQAVQILGEIKESVASNNQLAENCRHLLNTLRPSMVVQHPLRSGRQTIRRSNNAMLWGILMNNSRHRLSIGCIGDVFVSYGVVSNSADRGPPEHYEYEARVKWEFYVAAWFLHRVITTEVNVQIGSMGGLTMTPAITRSLTMAVDLSKHHPLWKSIDNGDILGVYQLLESGSVRLDDRYGSSGMTLMHYICYFGFPRTNPRRRLSQQIEILKMLITKGADCDSLDYYGRTPLAVLSESLFDRCIRIPSCRVHVNAGIQLLVDAGGGFYSPESSLPDYCCVRLIEDRLIGEESKAMFEDSVVECAWILLSADTHSLSKQEAEQRISILIQMAAGRYDALQSQWKRESAIQYNDENLVLRTILEELLSLSTSIDTIYPYKHLERALSDEFFTCRNTGCIDKINTVLSAMLEMSQDYAEFMAAQLCSWSIRTWSLPCYGNEETFMILQRTGLLDPHIVIYSKMLSPWVHNNPPEVAVWQRYIDEGIYCNVLNWLLVSWSNVRLSEQLVRLLIQEGANPNYACQNGGPSIGNHIIRPLEAAVSRREANSVYFLLECGADILAPCTFKGTLSGYAKSLDMTELANKLYLIESQERTKRNAPLPSGPVKIPILRLTIIHGAMLVFGTLLTGIAAVQNLILYTLGLLLRNRRLLWGLFCVLCNIVLGIVVQFGWPLLGAYLEEYVRQA